MALQTQGFALSDLPQAPRVAPNGGIVDVKSIYDGVRQGLANFELARTARQGMALADATAAAKTAEEPLGTRLALATTVGVEQQTPLKTAILASEASPEMQEAKRQALLARATGKPLTGTAFLLNRMDTLRRGLVDHPGDPDITAAIADTQQQLDKDQAAIAAKERIAAGGNASKETIAVGANQTKTDTTAATNTSREKVATINAGAPRSGLAAVLHTLLSQGYAVDDPVITGLLDKQSSAMAANPDADRAARIQNTATTAKSRENAARFGATNKIYETAAAKNEKIHEGLATLDLLNKQAEAYMDSSLGSGVFVGSSPMIALRSLLGDDTGKSFVAATALAMKDAVETMRGLGAMSEKEFTAAMSQLPTTNDPEPAIRVKLDFINRVRPWIVARSDMFLSEVAKGASPMQAHETVRAALPMPTMDGVSATVPPAATTPVVTAEEKAAAQAWLTANPNDPRAPAIRAKAGL